MNRLLHLVGLTVVLALYGGCGGMKEYTGEKRYPLSGKVTVNGQPMESGVISFLPQEKEGRVSGGPIKSGAYSVTEAMGPNAGKYRVEIHWNKPTGRRVKDAYGEEIMDEDKEGLPAKYHSKSELTVEVQVKQNTFDFELKTN